MGPDPSQPFPEIHPGAEYYLIGTEEGSWPLAINLMSREEAEQRYGPYLAAKAFDLVVAGLEKLYGTELYRKNWWQQESAMLHMKLIAEHPELAQKMLWSIQKKLF